MGTGFGGPETASKKNCLKVQDRIYQGLMTGPAFRLKRSTAKERMRGVIDRQPYLWKRPCDLMRPPAQYKSTEWNGCRKGWNSLGVYKQTPMLRRKEGMSLLLSVHKQDCGWLWTPHWKDWASLVWKDAFTFLWGCTVGQARNPNQMQGGRVSIIVRMTGNIYWELTTAMVQTYHAH